MVENDQFQNRRFVALLTVCWTMILSCFYPSGTVAVSDNMPLNLSIECAIQEMIDSAEPNTGHFSELELELIERREAALPVVIQMMTDERISARIHAEHVLAGIAKKGFGWSIEKGAADWREDDFIKLWTRLGNYCAVSHSDDENDNQVKNRQDAQRLWRKYAELVRTRKCHVGDIPLADLPADLEKVSGCEAI